MNYKNEFTQPTSVPENNKDVDLQHRIWESGAKIGKLMAEQFDHSISQVASNGQLIYKLEIVAWPQDKFNEFMDKLTHGIPGEDCLKVMKWIAEMDKNDVDETTC